MSYGATPPGDGLAVEVFVFREGRYLGSTVLSRPEVILGSAPTADVVLKSRQVAPSHAMVTIEDGQMVLTDLQSPNGSFVNGHRVERVYVGPLDEVGIGSFSIKLAMHQRGGHAPVFEGTAIVKMPPGVQDQQAHAGTTSAAAASAAAAATAPALGAVEAAEDARTAIVAMPGYEAPAPPRPIGRISKGDAAPPSVRQTGKAAVPPAPPGSDPWAASTATERPRAVETARTNPAGAAVPAQATAAYASTMSVPATGGGGAAYAPTMSNPAVPSTLPSRAAPGAQYSVIPPMPAGARPAPGGVGLGASPTEPGFEDAYTAPVRLEDRTEKAFLPEFDVDVSDGSTGSQPAAGRGHAHGTSVPAPPMPGAPPAQPAYAAPAVGRAAPKPPRPSVPPPPPSYVPDMSQIAHDPHEDDDDHDEDEDAWVEPFSVADQLISGSGEVRSAQPAAMAIVHTRDPEVRGGSGRPPRLVDCYRADLQRPVHVGKEHFLLGQVRGGDGATLFFREHWRGVVCLGGHERPLANLLGSARQARKGVRKLELNVGDWAQLETDRGDTFHVRVFRPPVVPKDPRELALSRSGGVILGSSTTLHAVLMLVVSFLAGGDPVRSDAEVFAEVKMEDLDLKLPETAAPETAAPETAAPETAAPKPEPAVLSPAPDVPMPKDRHKSKSKAPPAATSADAPDDAPVKSGAVAALEALKTSDDGRADIRKAVTNLTLVKGPAGMSSPFKTSAAMEKLPGGSLRMTGGSGKGAGVLVRTGGESVDGTLGGHGTAIKGAKTSKGVGGLVVSAAAAKATVSGSMDRAEILKVVNAHLAEIRRCYQKAVISGTAASGKAVFEWTIKGPGSVAGVRVKVSSLKNATVESCIMDSIKKWKFPAVKGGGSVVVSFPFVFSATDF